MKLCWITLLVAVSTCVTAAAAQVSAVTGAQKGVRNAADFPGPSIVERVQAAIRDCGPNPCEVFIPAGSYNASPIASWKNRDETGAEWES